MRIIAGKYRNSRLKAPKGQETRPTLDSVKEAIFNILQAQIEDCFFLDLFSGSGSMGLEALSRGAKFVCFIEHSKLALNCLKENIYHLGINQENYLIVSKEAKKSLDFLESKEFCFDIVYADPPYKEATGEEKDLYQYCLNKLAQCCLLKQGGHALFEGAKKLQDRLPKHIQGLSLYKERIYGNILILQFEKD